MSSSTIRLLLLAAVLVGLVLAFANPFRDSIREEPGEAVSLFPEAAGMDRIEITGEATDPVVLARGGSGWVVESRDGFPADTAAVGAILRGVSGARSSSIASNNPENRSKFQVDDTGTRVRLSAAGQTRAEFIVGKVGRDFTTSYVRLENSDDVHVVRGLNRSLFSRPQGLRDRTLFAFEPASVRSVRLDRPEGGWEVVRGDTAWTIQETGIAVIAEAKTDDVEQLIRSLSTLNADGFLDDPADTVATGLDRPSHRITVGFMNGSEVSVVLGAQTESKQYFTTRNDRSAVYLLAEWRVTNTAKSYPDLAASSEPE